MDAYSATKDGFYLVRRIGRRASLRAKSSPKLFLYDLNRDPRGPRRVILIRASSTIITSIARTRPTTTVFIILVYSPIKAINGRGSNRLTRNLEPKDGEKKNTWL